MAMNQQTVAHKVHRITPIDAAHVLGRSNDACVYFIRQQGTHNVAIGSTTDIDDRFDELQIGSPVVLQIDQQFIGDPCMVTRMVNAFQDVLDDKHVFGDWFRLPPDFKYLSLLIRKYEHQCCVDGCNNIIED